MWQCPGAADQHGNHIPTNASTRKAVLLDGANRFLMNLSSKSDSGAAAASNSCCNTPAATSGVPRNTSFLRPPPAAAVASPVPAAANAHGELVLNLAPGLRSRPPVAGLLTTCRGSDGAGKIVCGAACWDATACVTTCLRLCLKSFNLDEACGCRRLKHALSWDAGCGLQMMCREFASNADEICI